MIEIDVSSRETIPLSDKQFRDVITQITSEIDKSTLKKETAIERTHIFNPLNKESFEEGFQITLEMFKTDKEETGILITEMIIFEDNDEWLDAFNVINKKKKNK